MKERLHHEHESLLPETRRLLAHVEASTGRVVEIRADAAVRERGRAIYVVTDPNPDRHLILFDPAESRYLDHLVAHESGHILRFHEAEPDERVVPFVGREQNTRIIRQLAPELAALVRRGFSESAIASALPVWLSGTIAQLSDTPADIRIERWIRQEYPGLQAIQRESLIRQARAFEPVMSPVVAGVTPPTIWRASAAMNCALISAVARLLDAPELIEPYRRTPVRKVGAELLEIVDTSRDDGLASDHRLSEAWALRLGLRGWFDWRALDQLPAGFRHAWE